MPEPRPPGAPLTFRCRACAIDLCDGVEYTACPRCDGAVDWIDVAPPANTTGLPPVAHMARTLLYALLTIQVAFAVLDPHGFPYLRVITVLVQLLALRGVVVAIAMPFVLPLDRRMRIAHGIEHATAAILEEGGITFIEGQAFPSGFTLQLCHERPVVERVGAVAAAVRDAIGRIAAGETRLVYHRQCGTSWLVAQSLLGIAIVGIGIAAFALGIPHGYTFAGTVIAVIAVARGAVPLGLLAQRLWTVSTDFVSVRVVSVTRQVAADASAIGFEVTLDIVPRDHRAEPVAM